MAWRFFCGGVLVAVNICGCHDNALPEQSVDSNLDKAPPHTQLLIGELDAPAQSAKTMNDGPVQAAMRLSNVTLTSGDSFQLLVELRIEPGWHIYATDGDTGPCSPTHLELKLPSCVEMTGEWTSPETKTLIEPGTVAQVYEGNISFRANLKLTKPIPEESQTIQCLIEYQACNHFQCLQVATQELKIILNPKIQHLGEN